MRLVRRLTKRGGSIALNIPREIAKEAGLKVGDHLVIECKRGIIRMKKVHVEQFDFEG